VARQSTCKEEEEGEETGRAVSTTLSISTTTTSTSTTDRTGLYHPTVVPGSIGSVARYRRTTGHERYTAPLQPMTADILSSVPTARTDAEYS
jgi:hypothetical protein